MRLVGIALAFAGLLLADLNKGVDLYKQGKYREAEAELRGAVGAQEDSAQAHRYLGFAFLEQKKFDEAQQHLQKAAELDPSGDSKAAIARFHAEKGQYNEAEGQLADATGPSADYARGLIQLNRKQYAEAVKNIESFLAEEPNNSYAHYYAGLAYNGAGRKDKMLSEFELFLRMNPDAPEARKVRAVMQTGR